MYARQQVIKGQNNEQNGSSSKHIPINNYIECKWTEFSHQKTEWLNGYKYKTQVYVTYKRLTSALRTHTD